MESPPTLIAIAVVEHDNRFLVGRRPSGKPLAGFWEFPGGRVEAGESPQDAAVRECLEETGLVVEVSSLHLESIYDYQHGRVHLHFFACQPKNGEQPVRPPFQWVGRDELDSLKFPDGNQEMLKRLRKSPSSSMTTSR